VAPAACDPAKGGFPDGQAGGLPTYFAPTRGFRASELGLTLSRPGGGATAFEGRFGGTGDSGFITGIEARVPVLGHGPAFPLDGAFILGIGRAFDDVAGETFVPVGLSIRRRLLLDRRALHLALYAQPTVIWVKLTAGTSMPTFALCIGAGGEG
jgi:hypothetical protein